MNDVTCEGCGTPLHYSNGAWWDDTGNWPCPTVVDPENDPEPAHRPNMGTSNR